MIFVSDRKKRRKKGYVWEESGVTTQGRREVEVGTLLLGNGKNNVITEKVLSYFSIYSLSSRFEVYIHVSRLIINLIRHIYISPIA